MSASCSTPETRPLHSLEARTAAQQAFLEALKEPGLGDNLSRITVVVRLMPASHPDPDVTEQVIVYLHKGGQRLVAFAQASDLAAERLYSASRSPAVLTR